MINYFVMSFLILSFGSLDAMPDYEVARSDEESQLYGRFRALSFDDTIGANIVSPGSASFKSPQVGSKRKKNVGNMLSPSDINSKYIKTLNDALSTNNASSSRSDSPTPTSSTIFNFGTPEAKNLNLVGSHINKMLDTPGGRKRSVVRIVADKNNNAIIEGATDTVDENERLNQAYKNPSDLTNVVIRNYQYFSSPEKQKLSAIDLYHVEHPHVTYDSNHEPIKIIGGHNIQPYFVSNLLHENDDVFVAGNGVVGIRINNKISKTFYPNFNAHEVVSNVKQAKTTAETPGYFKISKSPAGYFVGTYKDIKNPLLYTSQFPLITLTDAGQGDRLYVGQFAKLNSDGSVNQNSGQQPLYISKSDFDDVVKESASHPKLVIPSKVPGVVVCDITNTLGDHFGTQFPTSIYGIKTR